MIVGIVVRIKNSIYIKIVLTLLITVLFITNGFNIYQIFSEKNRMIGEMNKLTSLIAKRVSSSLIQPLWNYDEAMAEQIIDFEIEQQDIVAIIVKDEFYNYFQGKVKDEKWEVISYNLRRDKGRLNRYDYITKKIYKGQNFVGIVEIYFTDIFLKKKINNQILITVLQIIIISILTFVIIFFSVRTIILKPLEAIIKGFKKISLGDLEYRVKLKINDEIGALANSFNDMTAILEKNKNELLNYQVNLEKLVEEKSRLINENITYAEKIQLAILPKEKKIKEAFQSHFILWKPKDIVGGDFYWFNEYKDNYLLGVVDCTGHGVSGALMTMTANSVLNHIITNICNDDPAIILAELNKIIRVTLHQNTSDSLSNDGMDMGLCYIIPKQKKLIYAGSKLSLLYINNDEVVEIKGDKQSIGYFRSSVDFEYKNHEIPINNDYTFYLITDGYISQLTSTHDLPLGKQRLKNVILDNHYLTLEKQKEILENYLEEYKSKESQIDDITAIGFKI